MFAVLTEGARQPAGFVASLPMYDLPEVREATDALWRALAATLRRRGIDAPAALTRGDPDLDAAWRAPNLLLSQTCGYPLMTGLARSVVVVATPSYAAPGCEGAFHRAAVIVGSTSTARSLVDLKDSVCAVNAPTSNTGMNLLRAEIAAVAGGRRFFSRVIHTGSHLASVEQIAEGAADVASIDAVTFALLQRHRPDLTRAVRILAWTAASPGLPLITSRTSDVAIRNALRLGLAEVAADPTLRAVRETLLLDGFAMLPKSDYRTVLAMASSAADRGYPELG
jgi:ABC-type phosphate/phosphonate transport system substrate-binding protein